MKTWVLSVGIVLVVFVAASLYKAATRSPSDSPEFRSLTEEIYTFINTHGELPKLVDFSDRSRAFVNSKDGLVYSFQQGLSYQFDEPHPAPLLFRLVGRFNNSLDIEFIEGVSLPPDNLIKNANIRKRR